VSRSPAGFKDLYRSLLRAYGPQGWWPGRTRFEVIVGAVLTQNVAWTNVEKAIGALRRARVLHPDRLRRISRARLAGLIRPAGYHNQKARTLRNVVDRLHVRHGGSLARLFRQPTQTLRAELLELSGIGPETADSILLYAAGRPVFVIDAYTRRILARHGAASGHEPYEELRRLMETAVTRRAPVYKEFHALLVRVAKDHCRKRQPLCAGCPLEPHLPPTGPAHFQAPRH
jgi:endonuclease III related protein